MKVERGGLLPSVAVAVVALIVIGLVLGLVVLLDPVP